ncbi:uncharacterized protein CLUP02_02343 [Colletotrichum lupini]|uniref:Uncharacterized protein n=1 Tax=Colletotrichum lupini TaxID=145971 RepID=A0A9Q8SE28_9PEZI|nr:uncharacterized protein CLUP02_02343 [Colletotrichum lupini]UQC75687.1 hypothetical protein CLUP02_02343 [Colletotrichum lupini]
MDDNPTHASFDHTGKSQTSLESPRTRGLRFQSSARTLSATGKPNPHQINAGPMSRPPGMRVDSTLRKASRRITSQYSLTPHMSMLLAEDHSPLGLPIESLRPVCFGPNAIEETLARRGKPESPGEGEPLFWGRLMFLLCSCGAWRCRTCQPLVHNSSEFSPCSRHDFGQFLEGFHRVDRDEAIFTTKIWTEVLEVHNLFIAKSGIRCQDASKTYNLSIGIEGTSSMVVNLGAPVQRLMRRKCCTSQHCQNICEPDGSSAMVQPFPRRLYWTPLRLSRPTLRQAKPVFIDWAVLDVHLRMAPDSKTCILIRSGWPSTWVPLIGSLSEAVQHFPFNSDAKVTLHSVIMSKKIFQS